LDVRTLLAGHHANVFAFLYRMCGDAHLAEDLMQETFVRALRAADRYEQRARVSTWLYAIAANVARDHWRRQQRRPEVPLDAAALRSGGGPDPGPEEGALAAAVAADVRAGLLTLPVEQRTALVLRYYHDLTYADIAEVEHVPLGTVRSRIHNGLERLKTQLAGEVERDERSGAAAGSR
jgi:RNA polymerase sigma-70 factor (ECF subfamily)